MINLIKKDLLIQKKSFIFVFFYSLFMFVIFNNPAFVNMIYVMGMIISVYFFLITGNMEDEKNKSDILLNSLPVLRSRIVLAKYVSVFVYMFIGAFFLGIAGLVFHLPLFPFTTRLMNAAPDTSSKSTLFGLSR